MARSKRDVENRAEPAPPPGPPAEPEVSAEAFRERFGEELCRALDIDTWDLNRDPTEEYGRIEREVRAAVEREGGYQQRVRTHILPLLKTQPGASKHAGLHRADWNLLARIHRGLLFNGGVEACDGTIHVHDTLPLTIYQVGVSLVSYLNNQGTWCQRLFRRDLRQQVADPVEEVARLLQNRSERAALNHPAADDPFGAMVQRALMTYAERAVLLRRSKAVWRMGHGSPIPYELLTGGGSLDLMVAGTRTVRELVEYQKFVFVASEPRDLMLLTIGQALRPLEYAIVDTLQDRIGDWVRQGRFAVHVTAELDWDGEKLPAVEWIPRFIDRVASQVVVGVYRATGLGPAQLFYAHVDHADLAAHIVLADSVLQEHRGFPLLLDLADHVCGAVFGRSLRHLTETAYAAAGAPWRYDSERMTRDR